MKNKKKHLKTLKPKKYKIHGIFDFKTNKLIYVNLDLEDVIFKFDIDGYNENDNYDVVSFDIMLS